MKNVNRFFNSLENVFGNFVEKNAKSIGLFCIGAGAIKTLDLISQYHGENIFGIILALATTVGGIAFLKLNQMVNEMK
jgi:hypothetical protein